MYENRINDFKNILAKVSGEDLFDDNGDGSLITTVHTGETIEAFRLNVVFFSKTCYYNYFCISCGVGLQFRAGFSSYHKH